MRQDQVKDLDGGERAQIGLSLHLVVLFDDVQAVERLCRLGHLIGELEIGVEDVRVHKLTDVADPEVNRLACLVECDEAVAVLSTSQLDLHLLLFFICEVLGIVDPVVVDGPPLVLEKLQAPISHDLLKLHRGEHVGVGLRRRCRGHACLHWKVEAGGSP